MSFILCKKWFKSRFPLAFAFARTVPVWAFSWRFCLTDGNVPKGFERCWKKFLVLRGLLAWALFFSSWTYRGHKECIMFVWGFIVILTILRHDVELLTGLYILTCLVGSEGTDISSYVLLQEADNIPLRRMNRATNHLLLARNSNCCPVIKIQGRKSLPRSLSRIIKLACLYKFLMTFKNLT